MRSENEDKRIANGDCTSHGRWPGAEQREDLGGSSSDSERAVSPTTEASAEKLASLETLPKVLKCAFYTDYDGQ